MFTIYRDRELRVGVFSIPESLVYRPLAQIRNRYEFNHEYVKNKNCVCFLVHASSRSS